MSYSKKELERELARRLRRSSLVEEELHNRKDTVMTDTEPQEAPPTIREELREMTSRALAKQDEELREFARKAFERLTKVARQAAAAGNESCEARFPMAPWKWDAVLARKAGARLIQIIKRNELDGEARLDNPGGLDEVLELVVVMRW